jgi:hypothetical protein
MGELYKAKIELKAMAGWAMVRDADDETSDYQKVAYRKLIDGCEAVMEFLLDDVSPEPLCQQSVVEQSKPFSQIRIPDTLKVVPNEVESAIREHQTYVGGGKFHDTPSDHPTCYTSDGTEISHKFDMKTQRCVYCGETYKTIKGKEPELMC